MTSEQLKKINKVFEGIGNDLEALNTRIVVNRRVITVMGLVIIALAITMFCTSCTDAGLHVEKEADGTMEIRKLTPLALEAKEPKFTAGADDEMTGMMTYTLGVSRVRPFYYRLTTDDDDVWLEWNVTSNTIAVYLEHAPEISIHPKGGNEPWCPDLGLLRSYR